MSFPRNVDCPGMWSS